MRADEGGEHLGCLFTLSFFLFIYINFNFCFFDILSKSIKQVLITNS